MNSREKFSNGAALSFNYNLPHSLALGLCLTGSNNLDGIIVIEPVALLRFYPLGGHSWIFIQADGGAYLILEDEELTTLYLGGLRGGFRLPLGKSFFLELYGRIGYPFVFGAGALTGFRF